MAVSNANLPYCGAPPLPDELLTRWNLDPILIGALVLTLIGYMCGARSARRADAIVPPHRQGLFYAGWVIGVLTLISPLCALSVSLFAARVGQHMILALVAAPLVMAGRPIVAFRFLALGAAPPGMPTAGRGPSYGPLFAALAFAAAIWFWHAPMPYAATFASSVVYWTMHLTVFGSAAWLWGALLDRTARQAAVVAGAALFSTVQMGLIGALITLAPRALYTPHALTTVAWSLTPLQDQELGGVIMWVPGCLAFFAVSIVVLGLTLADETDAPDRSTRATWA